MQTQLMSVPFHGDTIVLVGKEHEPYVAMRPIVENMGLGWSAQRIKIAERFDSTVSEIDTVAEDGRIRGMICLPLRKLPAWLYSISANKVAPELRDKVIQYQEDCDDVLWDYWTKGSAVRIEAPNVSQQIALSRHRVALLKELHRNRDNGLRVALHEQLAQISRQLGLSVPALDSIGFSAPDACDLVNRLWDALEILDRKGERYNHAPWMSGMIYLKLPHLAGLFKKHNIALHFDSALRNAMKASKQPLYITRGAKGSSIEGKTIRCWVFEGPVRAEPSVEEIL
ncbi:phage antirepressor N-terminal domain-containing protein [Pseudomonas granadensis]|uniref:phage antirepressor N-terminal domain-containing protein n=1 Tax=Pseudomonas granadensis TaxID=1421430 RepID=UPI0019D20A9D|nr:phage antirepressor N-terminal domain-containing protein [Pseudomonas granadensis]MBN6773709.1 phage antirepressor N-terminal domain-containing protein [Pseudomonas granadensis]MBN6805012.1 phage antirepressor N-terminal domain-containing protein [Pseudomonas granadensis]MBN6832158.1 phage antirepressor N-terminal domain-containing protein [Pseudomonas granadensis]MBN6838783.1 phage antirepressor N-terminal domain-containing protein [Pseudomonas granadensis]MBN6867120.1 phage antirepressor 